MEPNIQSRAPLQSHQKRNSQRHTVTDLKTIKLNFLNLNKSDLSNRTQQVVLDRAMSHRPVPQGSVIGLPAFSPVE